MTLVADKTKHYETIAKTCLTATVVYLVLHAFYLVLFIIANMVVPIILDVVAIAFYIFSFYLIHKRKYYLYALLCGNFFFVFVSVTTIMIGFPAGFHLHLIGLCVVSFFTTYFSKGQDTGKSLIWVGLSVIIYLVLYFVTKFNSPYYAIESWMEMTLFTVHAIGVFAFVAAYLTVFIKYALSLENKIINESRTDELTQISNRYGLYDHFDEQKDHTSQVLALFDVDDFKNINDRYGHVAGDYVLKRVAEVACGILNDSFVCRYGGEEFVAVLHDDDNLYFERLEAFRRKIEEEDFEFEGNKIRLTITIGAAKYENGISLEKWVDLADDKMYIGKNTGKNQTVI